ncbi:signal peptidase II [Vagococcus jeotgali]|uniref:signal peptidase II n=1 Tax=Vagococcus jeotgali TaxID=3109030 RepID=UPI002DDABF86|nr:signal peptidase II [Vagococcus sp. B2T-5]
MLLYIAIILGCVVIDQLVKFIVVQQVGLHETVFANPVLSITHIHNEGGAWSIFEGEMWFFILISIIALVAFSYVLYKNRFKNKWLTVGLSLIIGGTIGNFIDRFIQGYVVDMFQTEFVNFPIFNMADIFLFSGVVCVFIYILFFDDTEKNDLV